MLGGLRGRSATAFAAAAVVLGLLSVSAAAQSDAPVVLTVGLAETNPTTAAARFAQEVQRRSRGQLLITFRSPPGAFEGVFAVDEEQRLIEDVRSARVEMAWIPTRAWDTVGVETFTALQAPFLITDYALQKRVLTDGVARGMLAGTRQLGVRTLALVAADLRRPLGARHPLVSVADFRGAKIRVAGKSNVTSALLRALGAEPAFIASGADLRAALQSGAVDGAESSFGYALLNRYYEVAPYLTANLVFFARTDAITISSRAFEDLTPEQRSILQSAATWTTTHSFDGVMARDAVQLKLLCQARAKVATASKAQLAALKRAAQPVYSSLRRDNGTAKRIGRIQALKKAARAPQTLRVPAGCRP